MMSAPLVSVLIPCYNAEGYLGETLDSVFRQTWPNLEVIVVNDGSTDGSIKVAEAFVKGGLILISQDNAGASAARNRAFGASSGDFIQFLDADDLLDRDKIQLQVNRLLESPDCVASAVWGDLPGLGGCAPRRTGCTFRSGSGGMARARPARHDASGDVADLQKYRGSGRPLGRIAQLGG